MHEDNQRLIPFNFFNESTSKTVVKPEPKTTTKRIPTLKELSMKKLSTIQKPTEIDSQIAQKMIIPD